MDLVGESGGIRETVENVDDGPVQCSSAWEGDFREEVHANKHFDNGKFSKDENSGSQNPVNENTKCNGNNSHAGTLATTEPGDNLSSSSKDSTADVKQFIEVGKRTRLLAKFIFMVSLISAVMLAYTLVVVQWFLPYYYAVSAPLLIGLRVGLYFKYKWQYFLVDFCYFGNVCIYIFIWALPNSLPFFMVIFAFANGPVAWATCIFRNSLVFHVVDKMTSVYIHVLPLFVTYGIRWYSAELSRHWYTSFVPEFDLSIEYMFVWIVGVSLACFIAHTVLYLLVVYAICRPDDQYLNSYRYLVGKDGWPSKLLNIFGSKYSFVMYIVFNWMYCATSLVLAILWYRYFIAHSVYLVLIMLIVAWNGASYYIDVFSVRGLRDES